MAEREGRDEPRFTEKRQWSECALCSASESRDLAKKRMLRTLESCPECGQPPRCTWWSEDGEGRCARPASVDPTGGLSIVCCGQHYANCEANCEIEEARMTQKWLEIFRYQAEELGHGYLVECFDLAWAHSEMLLEDAIKAQNAIWTE